MKTGAFPLRYGLVDSENPRIFYLDSYLPWIDFSHGKLRMLEKMIQIELCEMIQLWMKPFYSLDSKQNSLQSLPRCLKKAQKLTLTWDTEFFHQTLSHPVVSTFGIDHPQGNSLLVIQDDTTGEVPTLKHEKDMEDFLYSREDKTGSFFVLDLWGFYLSPRRGVKPSIVTSVLRQPFRRNQKESASWERWKKLNPLIPQPHQSQVFPQVLQVERHACPLHVLYSRFHPSIPYLQDPECIDEHLYVWTGWKPYQQFLDVNFSTLPSKPFSCSQESKQTIKFQLDNQALPLRPLTSKRKEKDLKVFFGVASTWSRRTLFDIKHADYIFQFKIPIYKFNSLQLSWPSVPQQMIEKLLLYTPNPLLYKNKNSCMRGKTHSENLLKKLSF